MHCLSSLKILPELRCHPCTFGATCISLLFLIKLTLVADQIFPQLQYLIVQGILSNRLWRHSLESISVLSRGNLNEESLNRNSVWTWIKWTAQEIFRRGTDFTLNSFWGFLNNQPIFISFYSIFCGLVIPLIFFRLLKTGAQALSSFNLITRMAVQNKPSVLLN